MAKFEDVLQHCHGLSSLFDAYCDLQNQELRTARVVAGNEEVAYANTSASYTAEYNELSNEYARLKNARITTAQNCLAAARALLDSINDPHWHRMRQHYYNEARASSREHTRRARSQEELIAQMDAVYEQMVNEVFKLRSAFAPPGVANVIGYMIRPFRKERYTRIAELRNELLSIAVALCDCYDLETRQAHLDDTLAAVLKEVDDNHMLSVRSICETANEKTSKFAERFFGMLQASVHMNALRTQSPLFLGRYIYDDDLVAGFQETNEMGTETTTSAFTIPVSCTGFENSVLFQICPQSGLSAFFSNLALDILSADPSAQIAMIDITGLGRNYSALAPLAEVSDFSVLSNADQVFSFLTSMEHRISEAYAGRNTTQNTYLFVDDLVRNVPERCAEPLSRIISNGAACGVYVIASSKQGIQLNRHWSSTCSEIMVNRFAVHNNNLQVGSGVIALAMNVDVSARVRNIQSRFSQISKAAEVIPIWKTFPDADRWQKRSSANGISVPIGIDMQTGSPFYFKLTEEKPYALVVGDVDVGKSSALHCIALQIMAHYAPSEVRLAVGDFKDGCEFNTYVRNGITSVDAVVNSTDPDSMSSFLGYYVAEMHRRQTLFNNTSAQCGRIIRKYESYRDACIENQLTYVPRICLIIDEFQSLFDSAIAGTSGLLSELVRRGRTYGIHIVMASQRAVSDNPRNGFSSELKNYFTTRMVFRCPQQVARSMLSERCADTGRENPGISTAAMLKKGHAVINTYMGQNERDNCVTQCFYASDDDIEKAVRVLQHMNGTSQHGILLEQEACSASSPGKVNGYVLLGTSMRLKHDYSTADEDVFRDNSVVGIDLARLLSSIIVAGNDVRVQYSVYRSILDAAPENAKINLCGTQDSSLAQLLFQAHDRRISCMERIEQLSYVLGDTYTINVIIEPERVPEYSQANSYRKTPTIEYFDRILDLPNSGNVVNIIFTSDFKALKTNLPYLVAKAPLRIVGVGDNDTLRAAIGENIVLNRSSFDTPSRAAIKAYYHNKASGKTGKIVMFHHDPSG